MPTTQPMTSVEEVRELKEILKNQYLADLRAKVGKRLWDDSQKDYVVTPLTRPLWEAVRGYDLHPPVCLVISGPPGIGKTHLVVWKAREVIEQFTLPVEFVTATALLRSVTGLLPSEALTLMVRMKKAKLLVLDDLAPLREERARRDMLDLVDARYRHERATLVTTNVKPEEFEEAFGPQIASRLMDTRFSRVVMPPPYSMNTQGEDV